jgi:hypothetical protein
MAHYITKCACGRVMAQCRCPGDNKTVKVVERGCEQCHNATPTVIRDGQHWHIADRSGTTITLSRADWQYVAVVIQEHYHGED